MLVVCACVCVCVRVNVYIYIYICIFGSSGGKAPDAQTELIVDWIQSDCAMFPCAYAQPRSASLQFAVASSSVFSI